MNKYNEKDENKKREQIGQREQIVWIWQIEQIERIERRWHT